MKTEERNIKMIFSVVMLIGTIAGFIFGIHLEVYGGLFLKILMIVQCTLGGLMAGVGILVILVLLVYAISTILIAVFKKG